ncbi:hypothetical protein [Devosia sp.]|uniref:hypothetical protein n=1 Tax=Devosia sp. TaxID=1871048 RepID=UPI003A8FABD2
MRVILFILLTASLSGCMTQRNGDLVSSALPVITFSAAEYHHYTNLEPTPGQDRVSWFELVSARSRSSDVDAVRDRTDAAIAGILISKSDLICDQYFERVIVVRNQSVSVLQLGALAASGAVPLATPDRSGRLLGGVASFLTGSRAALEQTVFDGEDIRELRRAALTAREETRLALLARMDEAQGGTAQLAVLAAELGNYHRQCGIEFGADFRSSLVDQAARETSDEPAGAPAAGAEPAGAGGAEPPGATIDPGAETPA